MPVTARFDFTGDDAVTQGMPVAMPFAATDDTNMVLDYTGYTATFQLYPAPATLDSLHDETPILSLTDATGAGELGLFDGGDFGEYNVLLFLDQTQTSALEPFGRGVYFLDVIDDFGRVTLRIRGAMELEEGTTHA